MIAIFLRHVEVQSTLWPFCGKGGADCEGIMEWGWNEPTRNLNIHSQWVEVSDVATVFCNDERLGEWEFHNDGRLGEWEFHIFSLNRYDSEQHYSATNKCCSKEQEKKQIYEIIAKSLKYDQYIKILMQKITLVNMNDGFGLW